MEYKQAYIGTCIDDVDQHNLVNGTQYVLKDKTGNGEAFYVYQPIVNRFYGCYSTKYFRVDKEMTHQEVEDMMEHPVNYWGVTDTGEVKKPTERKVLTEENTNVPEVDIKPEKPKAKVEIQPAKKPKVSKPVQRGLFG